MCMNDAVHPPSFCDIMTNAYNTTARFFQSDYKGSTISNNHIWKETGALITGPLATQKRALQTKKQK